MARLVWITPWTAFNADGTWSRRSWSADAPEVWINDPPGSSTSAIALNVDQPPATDFRGEVSRYLKTSSGRGK